MFNIGPGELIIIALVLLIAVGPEQLPGLIRRIGQVVGQARDMTDSLRAEFMSGMDELERATDPNAWAASAGPSPDKPQPAIPAAKTPDDGARSEDRPAGSPTDNGAAVDDVNPDAVDDENVDATDLATDTPAEDTPAEDPVADDTVADDTVADDAVTDSVDEAVPENTVTDDSVDPVDEAGGGSVDTTVRPATTTGTWAPLEPGPAATGLAPSESVASADDDGNPKLEESA